MWNKSKILVGIAVSVLILSSIILFGFQTRNAIACIDIGKTFNEFAMKKELQKEYEQSITTLQKQIDSISIIIQELEDGAVSNLSIQNVTLHNKKIASDLIQKKKQMEQFELPMKDAQIQERMGVYLTKFGEENDYDILFAYTDQFPVIYSTVENDVTAAAIEFINHQYQGD